MKSNMTSWIMSSHCVKISNCVQSECMLHAGVIAVFCIAFMYYILGCRYIVLCQFGYIFNGGSKVVKFLARIQHSQRKLFYFIDVFLRTAKKWLSKSMLYIKKRFNDLKNDFCLWIENIFFRLTFFYIFVF